MAGVDVATVEWLAGPEGRARADAATAALDAGDDLLAVTERLRKAPGADPVLAGAAVSQAALRRRARPRFPDLADRLLWTADGLEQATRSTVADHRSRRVAALAPQRLVDLGCGVGGDLLALAAAAGRAVGVERDPVTAAVARANVAALGLAHRVTVVTGDVTSYDLDGVDVAFVDPARRGGGRRRFDPRAYEPPYAFVLDVGATVPAAVAKVAPGIPHDAVPDGVEAEWVSDAGDLKEAALWFGGLARVDGPARRRATLLPSGATLVDDPQLAAAAVGPVGRYLHEPDDAVVRAGLVAEAARAVDGWLVDRAVAYVTTDSAATSPYTRRYAVEASLPFQLKRLRAHLRELGAGDVVVKKRASAVDPEDLRRRLGLRGDGPTYTVLLTRTPDGPLAVVTTPAPG
jgi:SAM-dependent methyltransferase